MTTKNSELTSPETRAITFFKLVIWKTYTKHKIKLVNFWKQLPKSNDQKPISSAEETEKKEEHLTGTASYDVPLKLYKLHTTIYINSEWECICIVWQLLPCVSLLRLKYQPILYYLKCYIFLHMYMSETWYVCVYLTITTMYFLFKISNF